MTYQPRRRALLGCLAAAALPLLGACERAAPVAVPDSVRSALAGPSAAGPAAAVAMPDIHSAEAARAVLNDGGNAVDAAVAAAFVLAVTLPEAGNIGGGGFMTLVVDGEPAFLDFRETAPAAAHRDMYLDENGEFLSRTSQVGARAAGVPGSVRGLAEAHAKFGSLPWARLLEPAVKLARDGFVVPPDLAAMMTDESAFFGDDVNFADYFSKRAGERFVQPDLAATLARIADKGADEFYAGETARLTADYMAKAGGIVTLDDLKAYRAVWRAPLTGEWKGYRVVSAPPPSSGGIALMQLLQMKEALTDEFAGVPRNSARYVHLVAEMEKRVFADRAEYLGDPDYYDVPVVRLTARDYAIKRAREVNADAISPTEGVKPGVGEPTQTTHFSILDFNGDAVAVTTTLNAEFGSGAVVEGAGYLLNNEMDDFSAKPGAPNLFGVVGADANAIAPGKRMLSSMTPTILLNDGAVAMVVGTPGGPTIFTSVFQAIVNHVDYGLSATEAVASGRFHHQLLPKDEILFDRRIENRETVAASLRQMGYRIVDETWGDLHIVIVGEDGAVEAASDPRGRGAAMTIARRPKS